MSMFDDIAQVFIDCAGITPAVDRLMELRQQYEALAPDWTSAPEWAQWYTIDADGEACFTDIESEIVATVWSTYSGNMLLIGSVNLPIGIDWRLCKWQRPEMTA